MTGDECRFDSQLDEKTMAFFTQRGISDATLVRNAVQQESNVWSPAANGKVTAIAFPYYRNGKLVNIKYRGPNKTFWQVKGAEKALYGLDYIVNQEWIIIVEGEIDKLALEEAGFSNVVSVPDGAPIKVRVVTAAFAPRVGFAIESVKLRDLSRLSATAEFPLGDGRSLWHRRLLDVSLILWHRQLFGLAPTAVPQASRQSRAEQSDSSLDTCIRNNAAC